MEQANLRLELEWDGQRVSAASIRSSRTPVARLLVGLPAERAALLVPRLFSLCGKAQGAAAEFALSAAQGLRPAPEVLEKMAGEVALEAIGEHLWRFLLDWPALLGQPSRRELFLQWRRRLVGGPSATLGADLLDWLEGFALSAVDAPPTHASVPLLPSVSAAEWAGLRVNTAFSVRPEWQASPAETGALARWAELPDIAALCGEGERIAARLAARLADLRFLASALAESAHERFSARLDAATVAPSIGLASVETARGLLLHVMHVKDGMVGGYVIVAPTEWNFHPQGAFIAEMVGMPAGSHLEAEFLARRLALSLDPCVPTEVVITNA